MQASGVTHDETVGRDFGRPERREMKPHQAAGSFASETVGTTAPPNIRRASSLLMSNSVAGRPLSIGLRQTIGAAAKYSQFCLFEGEQ
jgi:hypothetical protein